MPAKSMADIALLLKKVKFKKRLFGGVDERQVWKVIEGLQTEYRSLVEETEIRLTQQKEMNEEMAERLVQLSAENERLKARLGGDGVG